MQISINAAQAQLSATAVAAATPAVELPPVDIPPSLQLDAIGLYIGGIASLDHLQQLQITHVVVSATARPTRRCNRCLLVAGARERQCVLLPCT